MNHAISRTSKLKATVSGKDMGRGKTYAQNIFDAAEHELRLKLAKNADPQRWASNRLIIDGQDLSFAAAQQLGYLHRGLFLDRAYQAAQGKGIVIESIPPDAVLSQEVLLTASPNFFTRETDGQGEKTAMFVLDRNYQKWRSKSVEFLKAKYGDNLLLVVEHLDELTPHLVGVVVPLVLKEERPRGRGCREKPSLPARWRFSASDLFNPFSLGKLWSDYADALKDLGLHRPPKQARISYDLIAHQYAALENASERSKAIAEGISFTLPAPLGGLIPESAAKYITRVNPEFQKKKEAIDEQIQHLALVAANANYDRLRVKQFRKKLKEEQEKLEKAETLNRQQLQQLTLYGLNRGEISIKEALEGLGIKSQTENGTTVAVTKDGLKIVAMGSKYSISAPGQKEVFGEGVVLFIMDLLKVSRKDAHLLCLWKLGKSGIGLIATDYRDLQDSLKNESDLSKILLEHYPALGQALAKIGLTNPQGHSGTGHAKSSTPAPNPTPAQSQRPRKPGFEI